MHDFKLSFICWWETELLSQQRPGGTSCARNKKAAVCFRLGGPGDEGPRFRFQQWLVRSDSHQEPTLMAAKRLLPITRVACTRFIICFNTVTLPFS